MTGLAILLLFDLLGLLLHRAAHIPVPEHVLGMALLLLALFSGIVKLHWVEGAADFLLRNMMLFFAPVILGVLPLLPEIQTNLQPVLTALIASTFLTLVLTALPAEFLLRREASHGS